MGIPRRGLFARLGRLAPLPLLPIALRSAPMASRLVQGNLAPAIEDLANDSPILLLSAEDGSSWLQWGGGVWRLANYELPEHIVALIQNVEYQSAHGRYLPALGEYGRSVARVVWASLHPLLEHVA